MGLTLQACDKGCLKCNAKNECIFCDTSNNYYLSGVNCAVSTLTNCLLLNSNGECGQCAANYYIDVSTKKCVAVETLKQVANCSYYGSAQVCINDRRCSANFVRLYERPRASLTACASCASMTGSGIPSLSASIVRAIARKPCVVMSVRVSKPMRCKAPFKVMSDMGRSPPRTLGNTCRACPVRGRISRRIFSA